MSDQVKQTLQMPDYLYRSGRLNRTVWKICDALAICPVFLMRHGRITLHRIFRAREDKARKRYIRTMLMRRRDIDTGVLFFTSVGMTQKEQDDILQEVEKYQHFERVYRVNASAAISSNCGPGTFGLAYERNRENA